MATAQVAVKVVSTPLLSPHADVLLPTDPGNCFAIIPDYVTDLKFKDACPNAVLKVTQSPAAGSTVVLRYFTTPIIVTVADQYGGSATLLFKASAIKRYDLFLYKSATIPLDSTGNRAVGIGTIAEITGCNLPAAQMSPANLDCSLIGAPILITGIITSVSPTAVSFNRPDGLAFDASGNLFVADFGNSVIRKITPGGDVTNFAGGSYGSTDGLGPSAGFGQINGITTDASGNVYVTDDNKLRKITPDGNVTTLAGNNTAGNIDGIGPAARFNTPWSTTIDAAGNIYIADYWNGTIRKITPAGLATTIASNLAGPTGIAVDTQGNIFAVIYGTSQIIKIVAGTAGLFAGSTPGYQNGQGNSAQFSSPTAIAIDAAGNLYIADTGNNRIRKILPGGTVTTFAGNGTNGHDDGNTTTATFDRPSALAIDASGEVYVTDQNLIRKINANGNVITYAGVTSTGAVNGHIDQHFAYMTDTLTMPATVVPAKSSVIISASSNNLCRHTCVVYS